MIEKSDKLTFLVPSFQLHNKCKFLDCIGIQFHSIHQQMQIRLDSIGTGCNCSSDHICKFLMLIYLARDSQHSTGSWHRIGMIHRIRIHNLLERQLKFRHSTDSTFFGSGSKKVLEVRKFWKWESSGSRRVDKVSTKLKSRISNKIWTEFRVLKSLQNYGFSNFCSRL